MSAKRTLFRLLAHQFGTFVADGHVIAGLDHGVDAVSEAYQTELLIGGRRLEYALADAKYVCY